MPAVGDLTLNEMQVAVDREAIRRGGLVEFGKRAWSLVEPSTPYQHNWTHDEICRHLQANLAGYHTPELDARKLVINVPPGTGKSLWTSVFLTPWVWTVWPGACIAYVSYDITLVRKHARAALDILNSDWYRKRWPHVQLKGSDPSETDFFNKQGGNRFATSTGSKITGRHFHLKVVDDPTKPSDILGGAQDEIVALKFVKEWWSNTLSSRNKDPANARYCVIMQRLHEDDLAGHLIATDSPVLLKLPMRFDINDRCWNPGIGGDRRAFDGQLLWPERYPEEAVSKLEYNLGVFAEPQLQQNPTRADGELFKAEYLRYYDELPAQIKMFGLSVDCSFKEKTDSDYVSIQVWGRHRANFFLVQEILERLDFLKTCEAIEEMCRKYRIGPKYIEDKANGTAVISTLQRQIPGIISVTPQGGKRARANAVVHLHRAGNVWYPEKDKAPWVVKHISQTLGFPKAKHDDAVDAETQFLYQEVSAGRSPLDAMSVMMARRGRR